MRDQADLENYFSLCGQTVFKIKVCGITSPADALAAQAAGADAVGLNFYARSPRYVSQDSAMRVLSECGGLATVGVFVNKPVVEILSVAAELGLSAVQLHGDESPGCIAALGGLRAIRARRMGEQGIAAIAEDLLACQAAGRLPDAVLIDAFQPGRYGGTGETVAWADLADHRETLGGVPLILAGGLTPDNVAEAIYAARPAAVDVASGVESSPGVKDHAKVRAFVEAARTAFTRFE